MDVNYFERKCRESKNLPINEIMSKVTFVVGEEYPIIKAAALMVMNKIQTIPVVRNGKVVGIVPRLTLIKHMNIVFHILSIAAYPQSNRLARFPLLRKEGRRGGKNLHTKEIFRG